MKRFSGNVLTGVLALALCANASEVTGSPAGSGVLWEARTKAAQAREQLQAAANAGRAGNVEEYRKHETNAEEMFVEAKRLFEEAGGMGLEDTEALMDFAGVLHAVGDSDLAADALRKAARLEPENAEVWLALGRGLLTPLYRRPDEAERALKEAIETGAGGEEAAHARALLGRLYWDKGLVDFAEEQWTQALDVAANESVALAGMAAVLARRGDVVAASQRVQEVAQRAPDSLTVVHELMGKALQDFEQTGLWFEDTAEAHMAYASLLLRVGRYAESLAPLQRAVKLNPDDHVAWNMIGSISAQLGRTELARQAFERSLELEPDQERTREALKSLPPADAEHDAESGQSAEEGESDASQGSGTGASSGSSK